MSFRLNSVDINRRPSRPMSSSTGMFNVILILAAGCIIAAAADMWLTDGRTLKFLLSDGMRPFRTLFSGLHVSGL